MFGSELAVSSEKGEGLFAGSRPDLLDFDFVEDNTVKKEIFWTIDL